MIPSTHLPSPAPSGPGRRKARVADEHITPCRAEADGAGFSTWSEAVTIESCAVLAWKAGA